MRRVALLGLLVSTPSSLALADDAEKAQAREHFKQGKILYNLGKFPDAAEEFEQAYRLYPDAQMLFNLARVHHEAKNRERAIFFYERYLSEFPEAEDRADVQKWIDELRRDDDAAKAAAVPEGAVATQPAPPPDRPGLRLAGWITAGVGAALLVTGAVFARMAQSEEDEIEAAYRGESVLYADAKADSGGDGLNTMTAVALIGGGAALLAGGVMLYVAWPSSSPQAAIAPAPGGLVAWGSF
ncbi:MAG: tetratricopeptide repeat protein [Myxococcota bacterium]